MAKPFVALDGEAIENRYVLLSASDGTEVYNPAGIGTEQAFQYLLTFADFYRREDACHLVGFGTVYDVNMILRDIPDEVLRDVVSNSKEDDKEPTKWGHYEIFWIPKKIFRLKYGSAQVTWYDVLTFFGTSFVKAIEGFLPGKKLDTIVKGKSKRSSFSTKELAFIRRYNRQECKLLVELMETLRDLLDSQGLHLTKWHGPGAVADKIMGKGGLNVHTDYPIAREEETPRELWEAWDCAFFGGRIENTVLGTTRDVYAYDLNSAYPYAAVSLPVLDYPRAWDRVSGLRRGNDRDAQIFPGVSLCTWFLGPREQLGPFPWRDHNGRIFFPRRGRGWFWSPEVNAAIDRWGSKVKVEATWYLPEAKKSSMANLKQLYTARQALKKAGNPAEYGLKIGLNSVYGKLAQRVGSKPYHCLPWAGMITSHTRAEILRGIAHHEGDILALATDAIFARIPLPKLKLGSGLGQWKLERYKAFLCVMNGFYSLDGTTPKHATRGMPRIPDDEWGDVITQLNKKQRLSRRQRMFIGHNSALHCPKALGPHRLTFIDRPKVIDPFRGGKRVWQADRIDSWGTEYLTSRMPDCAHGLSAPSSKTMRRSWREHELEELQNGTLIED